MTDVDENQISEWEKLSNEATHGPWILNKGWEQSDPGLYVIAHNRKVIYASFDDNQAHAYHDVALTPADAIFIAAARTAVPVLIARVRDLEARIREFESGKEEE